MTKCRLPRRVFPFKSPWRRLSKAERKQDMCLLSLPRNVTPQTVAQTFSLLYRRFPICRRATTLWLRSFAALAGCKPARQQASRLRYAACLTVFLTIPTLLFARGTFVTNGVEYAIAGAKPGDQVHPSVAINANGGFLVWEDNITSSAGLGISALRLDANYSASMSSFKV